MNADLHVIWDEFHHRLKRFIISRVRNSYDAEDILQEVFRKIHENLHTIHEDQKMESWIFQITRNTIYDYHRKRGTQNDVSLEERKNQIETTVDEGAFPPDFQWLKPMVNDLPDKYRDAILLTEYNHLSQKELSKKLHLSYSGTKSRVQRARTKLKEMLLECCHVELDSSGQVIDYEAKNENCRYCNDPFRQFKKNQ